jgi:hypothetical protein
VGNKVMGAVETTWGLVASSAFHCAALLGGEISGEGYFALANNWAFRCVIRNFLISLLSTTRPWFAFTLQCPSCRGIYFLGFVCSGKLYRRLLGACVIDMQVCAKLRKIF